MEDHTIPELLWKMGLPCHCTPACPSCRIEFGFKHANDWGCWQEKRRRLESEARAGAVTA